MWMSKIIASQKKQPTILNLFGYTGGATLCAAAAGAKVCHVDASKSAVSWASKNQELSGLKNGNIRWIVDDCSKFVAREIKRGIKYDGLIMDPPAFGRDNKGNIFEFEKQIYNLLTMCKQAVRQDPLFFIFNGYSMGYSATVLNNLLNDFYSHKDIEFGELHLAHSDSKKTMPCSLFARFQL
jgi:23S rRNA (cytosine1962-C5)-methyltransferase